MNYTKKIKRLNRTIESLALALLRKDKEIEMLNKTVEVASEIIAALRSENAGAN